MFGWDNICWCKSCEAWKNFEMLCSSKIAPKQFNCGMFWEHSKDISMKYIILSCSKENASSFIPFIELHVECTRYWSFTVSEVLQLGIGGPVIWPFMKNKNLTLTLNKSLIWNPILMKKLNIIQIYNNVLWDWQYPKHVTVWISKH